MHKYDILFPHSRFNPFTFFSIFQKSKFFFKIISFFIFSISTWFIFLTYFIIEYLSLEIISLFSSKKHNCTFINTNFLTPVLVLNRLKYFLNCSLFLFNSDSKFFLKHFNFCLILIIDKVLFLKKLKWWFIFLELNFQSLNFSLNILFLKLKHFNKASIFLWCNFFKKFLAFKFIVVAASSIFDIIEFFFHFCRILLIKLFL